MTHTDPELRADVAELGRLTSQTELNRRDEARRDFLLSKLAAKQSPSGKATKELREWFRHLPDGNEARADILAGNQTISFSQGSSGGYLVPNEFFEKIILGMAQFDPLVNENVVTLKRTQGGNPLTVPGWDLSNYKATLVSEGVQQSPGSVPPTSGVLLGGYTFRASLDCSFEFEQDSFADPIELLTLAFSIGLARGIGQYFATGTGTNQPTGILTGAANSGVTLNAAISSDVSATLNDSFQEAYFSVNEWYRKLPKAGWLLNDVTYQWLRSLTDKNARPLISIENDRETIMGKPVFICPSLPAYGASPSVTGKIIFGDLGHYTARISEMTIQRSIQTPGYVEYGKQLFIARIRADGNLLDPTSGGNAPLVYISVN
jgi:HK97 family phage major capsid protein